MKTLTNDYHLISELCGLCVFAGNTPVFVTALPSYVLRSESNSFCYRRISFNALSPRMSFFCLGERSGRSHMPLTVFGNVESKCG
jgi:hypothetical protein